MEGGRYSANSLGICLDLSNAFMRVIRAAMSRSESIVRSDETLRGRFLRLLASCDLVSVTMEDRDDDDDDELELEESDALEEFPLTFRAHLVIASSSLAAMAPIRPPARNEEEDEEETEEAELEERDEAGSGRSL